MRYVLDDAEQIDIGVVEGEVDKDDPGRAVDPLTRLQFGCDCIGLIPGGASVGGVASAAVRSDQTPMRRTLQLLFGKINETGKKKTRNL